MISTTTHFPLLLIFVSLVVSRIITINPIAPHWLDNDAPVWEIAHYENYNAHVGDSILFYYVSALHDVFVFDNNHHLQWAQCVFPETAGISELPALPSNQNINIPGQSPIPLAITTYVFDESTEGQVVYFACSAGNGSHCLDGMKFQIRVLPRKATPRVLYPAYQFQLPQWTLLGYPNIEVQKGDSLVFSYNWLSIPHDVWIMQSPCSLDGAVQIGGEEEGGGAGLFWPAACPDEYPCDIFIGCSCRPDAIGSTEVCGVQPTPSPLLHCEIGQGFYVHIKDIP